MDWRISAATKTAEQDARLSALPQSLFTYGTVTPEGKQRVYAIDTATAIQNDLEYLRAGAGEIARNIREKKSGWTATRVLEAYFRSAVRAHEATHCLTEILFLGAFERAKQLDVEFARTGKVKGPLHGVPVSLKDLFNIQGEDSTIGFTQLAGKPSAANSTMFDLLVEAGAIPFVKTNVPQTMLSFECSNPLFGTTHNPYKHGHTPGGSSGGEAALVASDGSPLGIGSDIGGSLRIPGHYSGCYGLKPCHSRFPTRGGTTPTPGFEALRTAAGPMGRCVDDLIVASKTLLSSVSKYWRTQDLVPIPWREEQTELPSKLRIGYYTNDQIAKASPACQRAVSQTIAALEKQGHECIEVDVDKLNILEAIEIFVALTSADGYETLLSGLKGDPRESSLFLVTLGPSLPWPVRYAASFLLRKAAGDEVMSRLIAASRKKEVKELQAWQYKRSEYAHRLRTYLWKEMGFDAVICPTQAMPAIPNGASWNRSVIAEATFLYNVCDSTVGQVPVTFVDAERDVLTEEWRAQKTRSPLIHRALYGDGGIGVYDPAAMSGLPVGIQVVGGQWEEERVLAMMKVVEKALAEAGEVAYSPGKFAERKLAELRAEKKSTGDDES